MNILVLSAGNAARSILLEAILNEHGAGRVHAFSAGPRPAGAVHPQALKLLEELGYDTSRARPDSWEAFAGPDAPEMDMVITLGDSAAVAAAPAWPGAPVRGHWGGTDPAALPEDDWEDGFRAAYDRLMARAALLLKQPIETMEAGALKALLDRIGRK